MSSIAAPSVIDTGTFFQALARAHKRILFVDYDGTLAPFVVNRREAHPYPGVAELLSAIRARGTRVVVVTGRVAQEVRRLLPVQPALEIWGSHGFERLLPGGEYATGQCAEGLTQALSEAYELLIQEGLGELVEQKLSGIAVHWRGLSPSHAMEVAAIADRTLATLRAFRVDVNRFDGGVELRARGYDKGRVVKHVLEEESAHTVAAFLGDDLTDEDGFGAIQSHGIGVLVRTEWRPTGAQIWLKPPGELFEFLNEWISVSGGAQ